jgi:hypothetical protein
LLKHWKVTQHLTLSSPGSRSHTYQCFIY